ncbi:MAG: 1-deoxy-D-xylulose-5-phosphate synthase [Lentisphaerae bacterium]|nr:1-deoxy-D-xylulose-5-phosphate synthase [Lentisphaerota bacterium]
MDSLLATIDTPADVRALDAEALRRLADEVRARIIDTVSRTGGHLGANLGAVELTVALLKVFEPPADKLVWDVGHQTYAYKLLTGRRDRFDTLRRFGGLSGFLRRDESPYDAFGAGHSGTALSAALGMAVARDRRGGGEHVVAIVGDGAAGCGISLEALNNLAGTTGRLIVVLNDNEMSIAANVGSLARYLAVLLANPRYNRWKTSVESVAKRFGMGWLRQRYYRIEEVLKGLFLRSLVFEEFGLRYIGPIDGHSIPALTDALRIAAHSVKPILLHVSTRKGKGYPPAEAHPEAWHGTSGFDVATGVSTAPARGPSYADVFGRVLERLAEQDPRLVAITAAMTAGTGLEGFKRRFPDRFFDVGICEEHAVVFAAGLAAAGRVPVFAVYSTFAQRAVDCVIHDVCLQGLPVVFCLDRAGVVGADGPTHHGVFDMALFRVVPGLTLMQPKDEAELAAMLVTAVRLGKPAMIRYPRGGGPGAAVPDAPEPLAVGRAEVLREPAGSGGAPVWFWALGNMLEPARGAAALLEARGVPAGVVNARFIKPLDEALLAQHGAAAQAVVTVEDGVAAGGFGSAVQETIRARGLPARVWRFGWPDRFVPHGSAAALRDAHGLTAEAIAARVADEAAIGRVAG